MTLQVCQLYYMQEGRLKFKGRDDASNANQDTLAFETRNDKPISAINYKFGAIRESLEDYHRQS